MTVAVVLRDAGLHRQAHRIHREERAGLVARGTGAVESRDIRKPKSGQAADGEGIFLSFNH
jgi:hypothetical protein